MVLDFCQRWFLITSMDPKLEPSHQSLYLYNLSFPFLNKYRFVLVAIYLRFNSKYGSFDWL